MTEWDVMASSDLLGKETCVQTDSTNLISRYMWWISIQAMIEGVRLCFKQLNSSTIDEASEREGRVGKK